MTLILNEQITRANVPIPDQQVSEIIKATPEKSVVLNRARKARLSTKVAKQPVLSALPEAYWVNGDTGLKQTTSAKWENVTITAEERAVLVPIPTALVDDVQAVRKRVKSGELLVLEATGVTAGSTLRSACSYWRVASR